MKATLDGHVIAESNDIVEVGGYQYFPDAAVRLDWLQKAPKTDPISNARTACSSTTS